MKENVQILENQAGFTKGAGIEDNLFLLNYCIEYSFKCKKTLYVVVMDYSKAFDSVKRKELIEAMKTYRMRADIINAVANIYTKDFDMTEWANRR